MENIGTTIDWDRCSRSVITADGPLPDNIRAIRASALDGTALQNAVQLIGGSVTSVNIEIPNTVPELIGFPHHYIGAQGRFNFEAGPTQSHNDLKFMLCQEFGRRICATRDKTHKDLLDIWKISVGAMIDAAAKIWPRSYNILQINGAGRFDQTNTHGFHRHGAFPHMAGDGRMLPGYLLNYTPSFDGTRFPGTDHNLWYAKGGDYSFFTTDGHNHVDGCDHEVPDQFLSPITGEKRATAALYIYPIPEI